MPEGRVVVTGATGFIGRALVRELASNGYAAIAVSRDPRRAAERLPGGVEALGWDGQTATGWGTSVEGALAVINLAGDNIAEGRWTEAKKARILTSRTEAGRAVVEAVRGARRKPSAVIQASAVGAYGPCGDEELDEGSALGTGFLASVVRLWEASTEAVASMGVRHVIARTGLVLGRDGGLWPRLALPLNLFAGGPLGSGRQWLSWISLLDEVRAIRFLLERGDLEGVFNLTAPSPVRQRDLCRTMARAMRRPCWLPAPAPALKILFGKEKACETLLAGQRALPKRLLSAGFSFRHPDAATAVAAILRSGPPEGWPED